MRFQGVLMQKIEVKKIKIQVNEYYDIYTVEWKKYKWIPQTKVLKKYPIDKGSILNVGEIKKYNFKIILPKKWKPKVKKHFRNWKLVLGFFLKTGIITTVGVGYLLPT